MPSSLKEILEWKSNLWDTRSFLPTFLFWGGGAVVYYTEKGVSLEVLIEHFKDINSFDNIQIEIFAVLLLLTLLISNIFYELVQFHFIRLLEGYWILFPPKFLKKLLVNSLRSKLGKKREKLNLLEEKYNQSQLNDLEMDELKKIKFSLKFYPKDNYLLPTKFGNLMSSTDEYSKERYGLQIFAPNCRGITEVLPQLWSLLTEDKKSEVNDAKVILLDRIRWIFWILMFSLWTPLIWKISTSISLYPILISLILSFLFYYEGLIPETLNYCYIIRVVYDLTHIELYKAYSCPLPNSPKDEIEAGVYLSAIIDGSTYTDPNQSYQYFDANKAKNEFYLPRR